MFWSHPESAQGEVDNKLTTDGCWQRIACVK